ncbi:MAG: hypothetical protein Q4G07_04985 [Oscillospiraceae bacterium]|nr:hypothetical protein [Oscillospiraceae bacterium]
MKKFLAVVCICGIIAACLCACGQTRTENGESVPPVNGTSEPADGDEPKGGEAAGSRTAAVGGCLLTVPQGYTIHIDGGIVLTHPEYNWQMLCVVKDRPYTVGKEDPAFITQAAEDAGYTITKQVDFVTLDGREYEYFAYDDGYNNMLLVNTQAPGDKTLVGLAVRYGSNTEEETLRELHVILSTAAPTQEADSTEEELVRRGVIPADGTLALEQNGIRTAAVTYELEDFTLTAAVPDIFYWMKGENDPGEPAKRFMTADGGIEAAAYFAENFAYEDISDCVRDATEPAEDYQNVVLSDMQTETVDGRTVYYQSLRYEYYWEYKDEHAVYNKLAAATSFENGCYMLVIADQKGDGGLLDFDSIRAFFEKGSAANVNTIVPGSGGLPEERRHIASQQEAEEALREDGQKARSQTGSPTLAELETRMEEAYGLYAVNLGAMPLPVAQQVEEAFAAMYQQYPQLRGSVTNLSVGKTIGNTVAVTAYNAFI